jgi:hypothetical protein
VQSQAILYLLMGLTLESYTRSTIKIEMERRTVLAQRGGEIWDGVLRGFWSDNQAFGIASYFLEHDLMKAKQHFYLCGRFEEISVKYFNNQVFDYGPGRTGQR